MTSKTDKLDYKFVGILCENFNAVIEEDCPYCKVSALLLKACKESGLRFTRRGVRGDDLEGACICKVEEIETNDED